MPGSGVPFRVSRSSPAASPGGSRDHAGPFGHAEVREQHRLAGQQVLDDPLGVCRGDVEHGADEAEPARIVSRRTEQPERERGEGGKEVLGPAPLDVGERRARLEPVH